MNIQTINHEQISAFITTRHVRADSKWPALLQCLYSHQFEENLSAGQRRDIAALLGRILQADTCREDDLQAVYQEKEAILNAVYIAELQGALQETTTLLQQFRAVSSKRVADIIDLEKAALDAVHSGRSPSAMVTDLRRAFRAVIKVMEEDNKALEMLSTTDYLTKLANRRLFDTVLQQSISESTPQQPLALLLVDIDDFKNFNDSYGHLCGDEVLRIVGKIIKEAVAECNSKVAKKYLSARYGGEEFGIIMPQSTEKQCLYLAEFIRERIARYPIVIRSGDGDILKHNAHITVSAGFCLLHPLWLHEEKPADMIIAAADKALYAAKTRGRNMVCQCKPYLNKNEELILTVL